MTKTYVDPDEPFDVMSLYSVNPGDLYDESGWIVAFRVPDDATLRVVLERWGPK